MTMRKASHLLVLTPHAPPSYAPVDGASVTTIGSGPRSTLRLADPEVVAAHAELRPTDGGLLLVRLGATVRVNGARVQSHVLAHGDLVTLGRTALSLRPGPPPPPVASGGDGAAALATCRSLHALSRQLASGAPPADLAARMLADVLALAGAERGLLVGLTGDEFDPESAIVAGDFPDDERSFSRTVLARILDERLPLRWSSGDDDRDFSTAPSLMDRGVRSLMCAPVLRGDQVIGALYVSTSRASAPFSQDALELFSLHASQAALLLASAEAQRSLGRRAARAEAQVRELRDTTLVGSSPVMQALDRQIAKVAGPSISVLVLGETGTGKELVARELHRRSNHPAGPFVAVNCGSLPAELLQSELFGHVKGAFTGAGAERVGWIRSAHGGTLFLDEIGEMPLPLQVMLLRTLEDRQVTPVGSDRPTTVDFRLVCATHRDLEAMVARGTFRSDLYFRLAGVVLRLPPLRDRGDDAADLAQHFLRRHRALLGRPEACLSSAALRAVRAARWDGNVRQLEASIRRAIVLADSDTLHPADLGLDPASGAGPEPSADVADVASRFRPLVDVRDEFLKQYVRRAVDACGGNRTAAAEALAVTPRTVFKYLEEV